MGSDMKLRIVASLAIAFLAATSPAQAAIIQYQSTLGPEATGATGTGTVALTFDSATSLLDIDVTFSGLSGITTVAHIHCCTAVAGTGTAGVAVTTPTLPGFPVGVSSGTYLRTFDMLLPLQPGVHYRQWRHGRGRIESPSGEPGQRESLFQRPQ
jgi:CHRD domain